MLFEDLHWIDSESQALLDGPMENLPTARILLVLSYRPEYQHDWESRSYYTQLSLGPFPPEGADELLAALLGQHESLEALKRVLIERTGGNPFFLEETVQALVETGVLVGERGAYRIARGQDAWPMPATVQAILAARIDRLPPDEKWLLQAASVIGKDVPFALLHAIADVPEATVRRALSHLQTAEFLYETRVFPDLEYTFKHALTHEVAYTSVLHDRRRALHARIVEAVEALDPDRPAEQVERLAHHAFQGELWDKAVVMTYLRRAGARALRHSAYREAVICFEQALTALSSLPDTREKTERAIDLRLDLRQSLFPLNELAAVWRYLQEAEGLARSLDDWRRLGWVSAYMSGHHLHTGGHVREVRTLAQTVEAIAERLDDIPLRIAARYYLAAASHLSGDYRGSERLCRELMQLLPDARTREGFGLATFPAVYSRNLLARALAERGVFTEGEAYGHEGLQIAEELDHPFSIVGACLYLAYVNNLSGKFDRAARLVERAVALCREWKITSHTPIAMASLGHVYAWSGRFGEGVSWLEQALTAYESAGIGFDHSLSVEQLGEAYLLGGDVESACASADRAVTLARGRGERGVEAWSLRLSGDIASHPAAPT